MRCSATSCAGRRGSTAALLLLTEGVNLATFTPRNAYGKNGQWPSASPVGSLILNRGQRGRGGDGGGDHPPV